MAASRNPKVQSNKETTKAQAKRIAFVLFLSSLFTRPTIIGNEISYIGSALMLFVSLMGLQYLRGPKEYTNEQLWSLGSAIFLWAFIFLLTLINGMDNYFALSGFVQTSMTLFAGIVCLSYRAIHDSFFWYFRSFLSLCGISYLVTGGLSLLTSISSLLLVNISTSHYGDVFAIYFPFTITYGPLKDVFGFTLPRLCAGFREAGIAQAFFATAILSFPSPKRLRDWASLFFLFVGGCGTLSTLGLALVPASLVARVLTFERLSLSVKMFLLFTTLSVGASVLDFAIHDKTIGLAGKDQSESYWDREQQTKNGLKDFERNPLGFGYYSRESSSGINLIASLGQIGVFGAGLVLFNLCASILTSQKKLQKAVYVFPLFITALTSQPLLDAQLVFIFYGYVFPKQGGKSRSSNGVTSKVIN